VNYEERIAEIGAILKLHILPRYIRPSHMGDDVARAEINDLVEDLNQDWPVMPRDAFAEFGREFARCLRRDYAGRSWPTIATMIKALKAAREKPGATVTAFVPRGFDPRQSRIDAIKAWHRGEREIPLCWMRPEYLSEAGITGTAASEAIAWADRNRGAA
jgi:hypothetical protein